MDAKLNQVQLTESAFQSLQKELEELSNVKRPHLVDRLSFAMSQGDLSENADYSNAKEELDFLDGRILELQEVLKTAQVVKPTNGTKAGVGIGTKVTVKVGGKTQIFNIVGEWEADPINRKISHSSPLGAVLVGKRVGDKVQVKAPAGKVTYEILAVE